MIRKVIILSICLAITVQTVMAKSLVVTKEGKCIWGDGIQQVEQDIKYTNMDTGRKESTPISELHGVVPTIIRGKKYTPEQIQKYIDKIKKLQRLHSNLYRQLNALLQEWEALQKPNPELEDKVHALLEEFKNSDKTPKTHKRICMDMGMVRYKDLQGKYDELIDTALDEINNDYISVNVERLRKMTMEDKCPSIDQFTEFQILIKNLISKTEGEKKDYLVNFFAKTRLATYEHLVIKTTKDFLRAKSIDAYLEYIRIMNDIKKKVTDTPEQNEVIDKRITAAKNAIVKAKSDYTINEKGYPLRNSDIETISKAYKYCSTAEFTGQKINEECFILPQKILGRIGFRRPFSAPLVIILNQAQPSNRIFGMNVKLTDGEGMISHIVKLDPIVFKDGKGKVTYKEDFSNVDKSFRMGPNQHGLYNIYFSLVYLEDPDAQYKNWIPLSHHCRWEITP